MNKITNRQAICDTLLEASKTDRDIVVLCSDSRGSASMTPFAKTYPEQFVEVGIAEQNLPGWRPAARKLLLFHQHVFYRPEAMNRRKLMWHIPIPMLPW